MTNIQVLTIFVFGLLFGILFTNLFYMAKGTYFSTPKYIVGDCLSNGLFLEKIIELRKSPMAQSLYITTPIWKDKKVGIPGSTLTWIVDENYVKVNNKNCIK